MKNQTKSYIYALVSVLLWGSVPAISKLTMSELDFFQLTTYSLFFSFIAMAVIVVFQKKINLLKEYSKKDYLVMTLLGFIGIFLTYIFYFGGINIAEAADAQILNNTWQIFAIIFAFVLLKEKMSFNKLIALLLGFIGAAIVITKFSFQINPVFILGYLLALCSAITEGLFVILGKKYHYETFSSMAIYYITSFLLMIPTTFVFSTFVLPSIQDWFGIAYLGVFGIALPYAFIFRAMKLGDTAKVTSIGYLSPFLALVFVYLLLGDNILISQIFGLIFILGGILIQSKEKR